VSSIAEKAGTMGSLPWVSNPELVAIGSKGQPDFGCHQIA